mmetsp:Transcript_52325/g.131427  ORF Transcript_52325/g.131427 Transcript_52325/m.131427 type:complete len:610 (-) Transcript_52325:266-2095(-)
MGPQNAHMWWVVCAYPGGPEPGLEPQQCERVSAIFARFSVHSLNDYRAVKEQLQFVLPVGLTNRLNRTEGIELVLHVTISTRDLDGTLLELLQTLCAFLARVYLPPESVKKTLASLDCADWASVLGVLKTHIEVVTGVEGSTTGKFMAVGAKGLKAAALGVHVITSLQQGELPELARVRKLVLTSLETVVEISTLFDKNSLSPERAAFLTHFKTIVKHVGTFFSWWDWGVTLLQEGKVEKFFYLVNYFAPSLGVDSAPTVQMLLEFTAPYVVPKKAQMETFKEGWLGQMMWWGVTYVLGWTLKAVPKDVKNEGLSDRLCGLASMMTLSYTLTSLKMDAKKGTPDAVTTNQRMLKDGAKNKDDKSDKSEKEKKRTWPEESCEVPGHITGSDTDELEHKKQPPIAGSSVSSSGSEPLADTERLTGSKLISEPISKPIGQPVSELIGGGSTDSALVSVLSQELLLKAGIADRAVVAEYFKGLCDDLAPAANLLIMDLPDEDVNVVAVKEILRCLRVKSAHPAGLKCLAYVGACVMGTAIPLKIKTGEASAVLDGVVNVTGEKVETKKGFQPKSLEAIEGALALASIKDILDKQQPTLSDADWKAMVERFSFD